MGDVFDFVAHVAEAVETSFSRVAAAGHHDL